MNTSNNYQNNNKTYKNMLYSTVAVTTAFESEKYIRKILQYPIRKMVSHNLSKFNGENYTEYINRIIEQNNLSDGFRVNHLNEEQAEKISAEIKIQSKKHPVYKIINHILRLPSKEAIFMDTGKGRNAFFSKRNNCIACNLNKFSVSIFHEIQHKLNSKSSNIIIKSLFKIKHPLAIFGSLGVSACSILTRKKENHEKQRLNDKIKEHCGLLAGLCYLPYTIEECIANIGGVKIAKRAPV